MATLEQVQRVYRKDDDPATIKYRNTVFIPKMEELFRDMKLCMHYGKDVFIDDYKPKDRGCIAAELPII